jgi:AraC family transcriptional regulator
MPKRAGNRVTSGGLAAWQLRRVTDHIQANIDASIDVAPLAEVSRLSTGHFCRAFKVTIGETPHNFLIRQRSVAPNC